MWKFKKLEKLAPADMSRGEGIGMKMTAVFTDGTVDIAVSTVVDDVKQMENTLRVAEKRLNKREEELASIDIATYTLPPEPEPEAAPAPTTEELKAAEIAEAEQELAQEVERAKKEKEVAELVQADATVAEKLAALEALKAQK